MQDGRGLGRDGHGLRGERDGLLTVTGYLLLFVLLLRGFAYLGAAMADLGLTFMRYLLPPFAYILPLLVALLFARGERPLFLALPRGRGLLDALPLLPLFLAAVISCAFLTGAVMGALGLSSVGGGVAGLGFVPDLFLNCLLPALLEELFFRGLILSLLWQRMGGGAIWLSALMFALAHGSLYQAPYAFVGGVFLALAAAVGGSVAIPFLFHFANNFLSFALQYIPRGEMGGEVLSFILYATVVVGAVASAFYLLFKKKTAAGDGLCALFATPRECGKEVGRAAFASPLTVYVLLMLLLTVARSIL